MSGFASNLRDLVDAYEKSRWKIKLKEKGMPRISYVCITVPRIQQTDWDSLDRVAQLKLVASFP